MLSPKSGERSCPQTPASIATGALSQESRGILFHLVGFSRFEEGLLHEVIIALCEDHVHINQMLNSFRSAV